MKTGLKKSQKTTIIEFDGQHPQHGLEEPAGSLRPPLAGALSGGGRRRLGLQDL